MSKGAILVIRGGAIGDFVLTLPVLAALKRQFPDTRLEVLGYPHIAQLAVAGGLVAEMKPIDSRPLASFFARDGDLDFALSSSFAGFQVIFSYLYDPDEIFRTNLARITKAQVIQGIHRPEESRDAHATEQLLEPLQRLAIFDADPVPRLNLKSQISDFKSVAPTLAVHPGSGSEKKNWSEANWRQLLTTVLSALPVRILLVGGEAEGTRLERLADGLPPERVEILRSSPLSQVASRLAECMGFIGHDSGISHLAAAVGLPGLVLWGPTNATVWRPRSDRFAVLTAGADLASLPVGTVLAELLARWPDWSAGQAIAT